MHLGESNGFQKQVLVHPRDHEDDTPLAGKRDVYQKQGGADVAIKKGKTKRNIPMCNMGFNWALQATHFMSLKQTRATLH